MPTIDRETLDRWRTLAIVDRTGGTVGNVIEFYLDRGTGQPTWALVNTALFGARETFVPLLHATEVSDGLQVPYEKGHIKDAPRVDVLDELGPDEEATLLAHYGIEYVPAAEPPPADPGLVEPVATPGEADAEATAAPTAEPSARPPAEPSASTSTEPTAEASGEPDAGSSTTPDTESSRQPDAESSRQRDADANLRPEAEPSAGSTAEPDADKPMRDGSATEATAGTVSTAGEPPPAPGEAGWAPGEAGDFEPPPEPVGHDADLRHDDETAVEDARRDEAARPGEEPSMLERARRRLEGLVSGPGPASPAEGSRDAEDADRVHGEHPATDRDRR